MLYIISIDFTLIRFIVSRNFEKSLSLFYPDIIVYNAGTDILEGDPLGRLSISAEVKKSCQCASGFLQYYSIFMLIFNSIILGHSCQR